MLLAHVLTAIRFRNDPSHVVRDRHDLQLGTMAIGLTLQFFHHLNQAFVVAWNQRTALVEARLLGTGR